MKMDIVHNKQNDVEKIRRSTSATSAVGIVTMPPSGGISVTQF